MTDGPLDGEPDASPPAEIIHRGEGPYPHPCDLCGRRIESGEPYVLTVDGGVFHEVCDFFRREESSSGDLTI